MEEQILKIIQWSLRHPFNEEVCEEIAAKEITTHVFEFIKWFKLMDEITLATNYSGMYYWRKESESTINITEYHLEDIYQYWLENVKNK